LFGGALMANYTPYLSVAADLDEDGDLDLATTSVMAGAVSVLRD
jgi:hypothetical protein